MLQADICRKKPAHPLQSRAALCVLRIESLQVSTLRLLSLMPSRQSRCALRLPMRVRGVVGGLLFPSWCHTVLAFKSGACAARWRPAGRLRDLSAAACRFPVSGNPARSLEPTMSHDLFSPHDSFAAGARHGGRVPAGRCRRGAAGRAASAGGPGAWLQGVAVRSASHGFGPFTNLILLSLAPPLSNCEQVKDGYFFGF